MTRSKRKTKPSVPPPMTTLPTERAIVRDEDNRLHEVDRVVDTIAGMFKRGQIDARQQIAAQHYRDAWDALHSGMPCALDQSRLGGGSSPGSPSEWKLWGTERVKESRTILGPIDASIVWAVAGEGLTIANCTARMIPRAADRDERYIGQRFRDALDTLADHWVREPRQGRITGDRRFEALDPLLVGSDPGGMGKVAVAGRVG